MIDDLDQSFPTNLEFNAGDRQLRSLGRVMKVRGREKEKVFGMWLHPGICSLGAVVIHWLDDVLLIDSSNRKTTDNIRVMRPSHSR